MPRKNAPQDSMHRFYLEEKAQQKNLPVYGLMALYNPLKPKTTEVKIDDLRSKQAAFQHQLVRVRKERAKLYALRAAFVKQFPIRMIKNMTIDQYVLGRMNEDHIESFCYWLEKKLNDLGRIAGSPAWQYGVYFGKYQKDGNRKYRVMQKWGNTVEEGFSAVKRAIIDLLHAGQTGNMQAIADSRIADKFKGKILATYFPDKYLNIFSDEYLIDILIHFNLDLAISPRASAIDKQQELLNFKNTDTVMRNWTVDEFAVFLSDEMTRHYYNEDGTPDNLVDYDSLKFPPLEDLSISMVTDPPQASPPEVNGNNRPPGTYQQNAKKLMQLGDRAELIVMRYEIDFLKKNGRPDLAKQVDQISRRDDTVGFDILSYDLTGNKKHIEVKAVSEKDKAKFFITANEKSKAETLSNYMIYLVRGIKKHRPVIWNIGNIFQPVNQKIILRPTAYAIEIH